MAITTSVPSIVFTPTGPVAPTEAQILAGVQADQNVAFDGGLNPALSTPQGQLAQSQTAIIGANNDLFTYMVNMFDPNLSEGRWQDGIGYIYFITRNPAEPTVATATCSGLDGVAIPIGALAQDQDGNVYSCTSGGTIVNGQVDCEFTCTVPGAIACPAGSLSIIYQAVNGWDSVTNAQDGAIGQDVETRSAFEARRFQSVAKNSLGALPSVLGEVLAVTGLLDAYVTQNPTSSPVSVGGVTIPGHCLYVCALGGTDQDVADAIWTKKAPGCDTVGNTTVTIYDTNYNPPYPSYEINFERPSPAPILFAVDIVNSSSVPSDAADQIQQAIISAFSGGDGGGRARIGDTIYASRFYAPVAALGSWARIVSIKVGGGDAATATFTGYIDDGSGGAGTTLTVTGTPSGTIAIGQSVVDELGLVAPGTVITAGSGTSWTVSVSQLVEPTASPAKATFTGTISGTTLTVSGVSGTIAIGQTVAGAGVASDTVITAGSDTSWTVSVSQTVSSEAMSSYSLEMYGALADLDDVAVQINQYPTVSAADIAVTLS